MTGSYDNEETGKKMKYKKPLHKEGLQRGIHSERG
jgi:hypothetical protein